MNKNNVRSIQNNNLPLEVIDTWQHLSLLKTKKINKNNNETCVEE